MNGFSLSCFVCSHECNFAFLCDARFCFALFVFVVRLVEAANNNYPLSIIIVGIGDQGFGFLKKLDANNPNAKVQHANGQYMKRDIEQFVKFNDYNNNNNCERLAKDTLQELSGQFMSFIRANKIPKPKKTSKIRKKGNGNRTSRRKRKERKKKIDVKNKHSVL